MSVLDLVNYGNPILRKKCNQVTNFPQLSDLIDECNEEELADNIGLVLDSTSQLLDNVVPRLCLDNLIMRINHKI